MAPKERSLDNTILGFILSPYFWLGLIQLSFVVLSPICAYCLVLPSEASLFIKILLCIFLLIMAFAGWIEGSEHMKKAWQNWRNYLRSIEDAKEDDLRFEQEKRETLSALTHHVKAARSPVVCSVCPLYPCNYSDFLIRLYDIIRYSSHHDDPRTDNFLTAFDYCLSTDEYRCLRCPNSSRCAEYKSESASECPYMYNFPLVLDFYEYFKLIGLIKE